MVSEVGFWNGECLQGISECQIYPVTYWIDEEASKYYFPAKLDFPNIESNVVVITGFKEALNFWQNVWESIHKYSSLQHSEAFLPEQGQRHDPCDQ